MKSPMSVRNLAIGGSFEGYGSPGAAIDADVTDSLNVRVSGTTHHGEVPDDPAIAAALAPWGFNGSTSTAAVDDSKHRS